MWVLYGHSWWEIRNRCVFLWPYPYGKIRIEEGVWCGDSKLRGQNEVIDRGGVCVKERERSPLRCWRWIPMLCSPDQSTGLLLSFCSSPLPLSFSFLPSLTLSSPPTFLLSFSLIQPAVSSVSLHFSLPCIHHHSLSSPPQFPFFFWSLLRAFLPSHPWITRSLLLLSRVVWGMIHTRGISPLYLEPFSLSQLRVRDCVHSVAQLSPNSP